MSVGLVVADCFRKQPGPGAQSGTAVRTASPLLEEAPCTHNATGVKVGPGSTSSAGKQPEAPPPQAGKWLGKRQPQKQKHTNHGDTCQQA